MTFDRVEKFILQLAGLAVGLVFLARRIKPLTNSPQNPPPGV